MEIQIYLKILRKNAFFIVAMVLIGAIIAFSSTRFLKSGYKNDMVYFLTVSGSSSPDTNQRLDPTNITDTAVAILTSQDFLNETGISSLSVDAKKLAPQVVKLTLTSESAQLSQDSQIIVSNKFNQKLTSFIPDASVKLEPVGSPSKSFQKILNSKILAVFGALVGFLASLVIITLSKYLKL